MYTHKNKKINWFYKMNPYDTSHVCALEAPLALVGKKALTRQDTSFWYILSKERLFYFAQVIKLRLHWNKLFNHQNNYLLICILIIYNL